jgi:hypothetical protein
MKAELLEGKQAYKTFADIGTEVYNGNACYRGTEGSIEKLILDSKTAFRSHTSTKMFVIRDGNDLVARFALIRDNRAPDSVQVAFFEALEGLGNIFKPIKEEIKYHFPECGKAIVGLNGHLNYSAGILLNRFDEAPLFGLNYTPSYYPDYFKDFKCHKMATFKFPMETYHSWAKQYAACRSISGLNVRFMDKKQIKRESTFYTHLNNVAFVNHPFWTNRDNEEDLELFYPFRHLLDNENLIFAEVNGKTVGFYLWYPDFNQLVSSQRDLNVWDVLRFRLGKKPDTFRFTEIGIIPEYHGSPVAWAMINKSVPTLLEKGYRYCEGGFIFEANRPSMAFVIGILRRCQGSEPEPYRRYGVFETSLG